MSAESPATVVTSALMPATVLMLVELPATVLTLAILVETELTFAMFVATVPISVASPPTAVTSAEMPATVVTGTIAYDALTQAALYYTTNASANWTVNFRGDGSNSLDSIMATGESLTLAFLVTQGSTAYYNSAVQIDGNSVTPKWQGGTAPTSGNTSSIDLYVYNIVKTGSATFTVFASQTQFK